MLFRLSLLMQDFMKVECYALKIGFWQWHVTGQKAKKDHNLMEVVSGSFRVLFIIIVYFFKLYTLCLLLLLKMPIPHCLKINKDSPPLSSPEMCAIGLMFH